jgi:hypothetical protein
LKVFNYIIYVLKYIYRLIKKRKLFKTIYIFLKHYYVKVKVLNKNKHKVVKILGNVPNLLERTYDQTPNGRFIFGNTFFTFFGKADIYLVLNSLSDNQVSDLKSIHKQFLWGIHMEPSDYIDMFSYNKNIELYSRFYTNHPKLIKKGMPYIPSPPYVNFHIGKKYDFLVKSKNNEKKYNLGVIISGLKHLDGHHKRLQFLEKLIENQIEFVFWGRGDDFNKYSNYLGVINNKWDALSLCKYTIVLENSINEYYWSEKIVDALLAFALPLYYGCPNITNYLPEQSFIKIDIQEDSCFEKIKKIINSDEYKKRLPYILEARDVILKRQNIYAFIDREINGKE